MGTINDDKLQAVRTLLGVTTGDIQARWREHLVALTSGSGTLNDLEMLWLGGLGYTGSLNDRWKAYLTGLAYTGTANDQQKAFWLAGGPVPTENIGATLDYAYGGLPNNIYIIGGSSTESLNYAYGGRPLISTGAG